MDITNINLGTCPLQYLSVGYVGETGARPVSFDFSAWATEYGSGVLQLLLQRPGDAEPYPVLLDIDGTTATWTPSATDTAISGQGQAQLVYTVGGVIVKNAIFRVLIAPSLGAAGNPPEPYEDWLQRLTALAAETQQSALDAAGSAEAAEQSAGAAAGSAGAAAQSALDAEAAKTGAETASTTAGQSATLAGEKAAQAAQSAQTAAQKATDAQQSAEDAQTASTAARLAAAAAETSKNDAEAAADGANQAKTDAESAASAAAASATSAAASAAVAQELIDQIPDIEAEIDGKAPAIYETVGPAAIASFDDGADDMPLKSLTADLPVVQSGSSDPSPENVRPFVAKTNVTVTHTGVNLLGGKQLADDIAASCTGGTRDGNAVYLSRGSNNVNSAVAQRVPMLRGGFAPGTHTIIIAQGSTDTDTSLITVFYTDGSSTAIGASHYNATAKRWRYVSPSAKTISFLRLNRDNSAPIEYDCDNSGVFVGSVTIDTTVPYDGSVLNIPLPAEAGTVYAGTLTISADGSGTLSVLPHYASYAGETLVGPWVSSMDVYAEGATPTTGAEVVDLGGAPTVYQLTAEQIRTLAGTNNIWSDAGDVKVEYPADTKSYIDAQTAALSGQIETLGGEVDALGEDVDALESDVTDTQSMIATVEADSTASKEYAIGDLLVFEGKLYQTVSAISLGDTLIPDGNIELTTVEQQLASSGGGAVDDVQINGTSIVSDGVANVPIASSSVIGAVKAGAGMRMSNGAILLATPTDAILKAGSQSSFAISPYVQHKSAFYGLAKAAGDTTQASSHKAVGTYTETAKSKISEMLDAPEAVSGSTPTIAAKSGVRYVCGECSTLTVTLPTSGIVDVVFESGTTPTVLTVTPPTGVTLRWANGFDPDALEANTTYEINIADGLGVAMTWT